MNMRTPYLWILAAVFAAVIPNAALGEETTGADQSPKPPAASMQPTDEKSENQGEESKKTTWVFKLDEMFITATRTPLPILDIPRSVNTIDEERMNELNPLVAIDALRYQPGIWLEHRTTSTADPIIRGFAGQNILALVDGNTLSTLWGEGGEGADDMYGKIDPDLIERIEVIRGPASVLYGSNAIGGVINLVTRGPAVDYTEEGIATRFRTKATYGSAADEFRLRSEIHGATPIFKFMLGGSLHDIANVEGGRGKGTLAPSDSEAANWDFNSYLRPFGEDHEFRITVQDTHLTHTKRYYRPEQDNFSDRDALSFSYTNTADNTLWDKLETRFYYQYKEDRRRWLYGTDAGKRGIQKTATLSGDVQLTRRLGDDHRLAFGLHWERDDGESPGDEQLTTTEPGNTQKEKNTPDSRWQDYGLFLQDEWDLLDDLTLIASARYDVFTFRSMVDKYYVTTQDPKIDEISEKEGEFCGGLGLNYHLDDTTTLYANYARGYRLNAPNFGVWFVHDAVYRIPNPFLDPMIADQFEIGAKTEGEGYAATLDTYYTLIKNAQREVFTTYQGSSTGPGGYPYVEVQSGGKADIKGIEFSALAEVEKICDWLGAPNAVNPGWSVNGGFAWSIGRDREAHEPLQFVQPAAGYAALRYDYRNEDHPAWVELAGNFVRRFDRVRPSGAGEPEWQADPQDDTSGYYRDYIGVPGYTTLDLRGGIDLCKDVKLTMAVENLTDKDYRSAHSRMDSPGINFVTSLEVWF